VEYNPEDAQTCWPEKGSDGKPIDYQAVLKVVEDKTSKVKDDGSGGNPMQVWTFEVYNSDGRKQLIKDYVTVPACTFKIKNLARAFNEEAKFKARAFRARKHLNDSLVVNLVIDEQVGFDDQNKIGRLKPAAPKQYPRDAASIRREREHVGAGSAPEKPYGDEQQFKEDEIPF
jgi:hypothetical protein